MSPDRRDLQWRRRSAAGSGTRDALPSGECLARLRSLSAPPALIRTLPVLAGSSTELPGYFFSTARAALSAAFETAFVTLAVAFLLAPMAAAALVHLPPLGVDMICQQINRLARQVPQSLEHAQHSGGSPGFAQQNAQPGGEADGHDPSGQSGLRPGRHKLTAFDAVVKPSVVAGARPRHRKSWTAQTGVLNHGRVLHRPDSWLPKPVLQGPPFRCSL